MSGSQETATESLNNKEIEDAFKKATSLFNSGEYVIAEEIYQKILKSSPEHLFSLMQISEIARRQQRYDSALEYINKALEYNPKHPAPPSLAGVIYTDNGDLENAEKYLKQSVELGPNLPFSHYNLGHFYLKNERYEEAEQCFKKTIAIDKNYYDAYNNLGNVERGIGNYKKALQYFKKAYQLNEKARRAALNVATTAMVLGDKEETEKFARKALEFNGIEGDAYLCLSDINAITEDDVERMEMAIDHPAIFKKDEASICFALGKYYDKKKEYDIAFKYYNDGNDLNFETISFSQDRAIDHLVTKKGFFFTPEFFKQRAGYGSKSSKPFFVLGMPRSGTSLVEQIISNHSEVEGAGELNYIYKTAFKMRNSGEKKDRYPECLDDIDNKKILEIADGFLGLLNQRFPEAKHVIDKMPANFLYVGFLKLLFPNARVINCKRHPLDICLSIYFQNFVVEHYYSYDLEDIADFYKKYEIMMKKWHEILPGFVYDVYYEKLTSDPEGEIKKMIEFCGLEWQDQCLDSHKNRRAVSTASVMQVREPIYKTSQYRWKNYEKQVKKISKILKPEIKAYEAALKKA